MDSRTYIRLHDGMPDHPKVVGLSDAAFRLYVESMCWCSRHLTDGVIPTAAMRRLGGWSDESLGELLTMSLIEKGDIDTRWIVHDYTEHQRSAGQVAEIREAKQRASLLANHTRWHVDRGRHDPKCPLCAFRSGSHVGSQADSQNCPTGVAEADGWSDPDDPGPAEPALPDDMTGSESQTGSHVGSQIDPKRSPETETDKEQNSSSSVADKPRRRRAVVVVADGLSVTQRSKRITDVYYEAEPFSKWPAVNGIVIKAIQDGRWADEQIQECLLRIAASSSNDSVTIDRLRQELKATTKTTKSTGTERAEAAHNAGREVQDMIDRGELAG